MIWAISGVLALAGLALLAVSAIRLRGSVNDLNAGLGRLQERADQAQALQERLNEAASDAQRVTQSLPRP